MDFNPKWSGGSNDPTCTSCHGPITADQRSMRIEFDTDAKGHRGMSGLYHEHCGRPFEAMARAINAMSFKGF